MQEYRVTYEIDVDGDNPLEAARAAYAIMTDPTSMPPVLKVRGPKAIVEVDLYKEGVD